MSAEAITPTNGMQITADTRLASGVFYLPDGLHIMADGITLEGDNTTIISDKQENSGITLTERNHVTLRNLTINGFYHGVRADHCDSLTLEKIIVRGTQEIDGIDTFLYLWLTLEKAYGGAILLANTKSSTVRHCDFQHQMHGMLFYDCVHLTVEDNNASFNSGWGVYLSNTRHSRFARNQLDFCNRVFRRPENGTIRVEADAAGIVLVKGSSNNHFLKNSCLCGGDGIFLCGYEHPGHILPCNDNLFEENDCRLSPNNAIESTFSGGNVYRNNDCSRSNYGFWMGYSWDNTLENNVVDFNRWVGIAIEHGYGFTIRDNHIHKNGEGIRLFTRGGAVTDYYPNQRICYNFDIIGNTIADNNIGFNGYTGDEVTDELSHHFTLRNNTLQNNRIGAQFKRVVESAVTDNSFANNVVSAVALGGNTSVAIGDNTYTDNAQQMTHLS